jgi:hypothetical protein
MTEADEYIRTHSVQQILNDLFVAYLFGNITIEKYDELSKMVKSYIPKQQYFRCEYL